MIRTSRGEKTPKEALTLFKEARLSQGELLGIWRGLEVYNEGHDAAQYVMENPDLYSDKIVQLAREQITGVPVGVKHITGSVDAYEFLRRCGVTAHVKILIRKDRIGRLRHLLGLENLEMNEPTRMHLWLVVQSHNWSRISRLIEGTLSLFDHRVISHTADVFAETVETLELITVVEKRVLTRSEPRPISIQVRDLLSKHPEIFFDRDLFMQTCEEEAYDQEAEALSKLSGEVSLEGALMLFHGNFTRREFLMAYIDRFNAILAT